MGNSIFRNRRALLDEVDNFTKCFGTMINPFWQNNIFGFNVVAFDKWLKVPDGVSTWSVIQKRYGDEGIRIIERLVGFKRGSVT